MKRELFLSFDLNFSQGLPPVLGRGKICREAGVVVLFEGRLKKLNKVKRSNLKNYEKKNRQVLNTNDIQQTQMRWKI